MNYYDMSDEALLLEIGQRVRRRRLNTNITQNSVAYISGVSRNSVQSLESGRGVRLLAFVRTFITRDAVKELDAFVPDRGLSQIQEAKMSGRIRQRSSGKLGQKTEWDSTW